jgi:predicted extracellular nuclease
MKKLYSLLFLLLPLFIYSQTTDLIISKYGEGSSNNKFLEIYNGTGADVDLSGYSVSTCSNGCNTADEFDYPDNVTFGAGTTIANGDVYVIVNGSADASILAEGDHIFTYLSNGNDAMALTLAGATASS